MSVLNQCPEEYKVPGGETAGEEFVEYGMSTLACVRYKGHVGSHWDHYGEWLINGQRRPVPGAPTDWRKRFGQ